MVVTMLLNTHRSTESMSIDTKSGSLGTPYFSNRDTTLSGVIISLCRLMDALAWPPSRSRPVHPKCLCSE